MLSILRQAMYRKFTFIILPYLLIVAWMVFAYPFLFSLDSVYPGFMQPKENAFFLILPVVFAVLAGWWFANRFRYFRFKLGRVDQPKLIGVVVAITLAVSTVLAMYYVRTTSGVLKQVTYPSDILKTPTVMLYTIDSFDVNAYSALYSEASEDGSRIYYYAYTVSPLLDSRFKSERVKNSLLWFSTSSSTRIHDGILSTSEEHKRDLQLFFKEAQRDHRHFDLYQIIYFERISQGHRLYPKYSEAIRKAKGWVSPEEVVLIPRMQPFEERGDTYLVWGLIFVFTGISFMTIVTAKTPLDEESFNQRKSLSQMVRR